MKKQDLKTFIKNKGVYITLVLGALIIIAVLGINKSLSDAEQKKNGLVDLNESPDIVSNDDYESDKTESSKAETSKTETKDNNQFSQMDNDMLLEYDSYLGVKPKQNNNSSIADGTGITDNPVTVDNGGQLGDNEPVQPAGTSSIEDAPVSEAADKDKEEKTEIDAEAKPDKPDTTIEDEVSDLTQVSVPSTADLSFATENGLMWPVKGNVILGYSADHAIYHATLLQFKVNPAILISALEGTEVKAAGRGIISDIYETPQTGLNVVLDLGDGYTLVYGQLADIKYKIGDFIEAGEVFAVVGKVSKYYSVEGEHLYFQVHSGESTLNPMLLLNDE